MITKKKKKSILQISNLVAEVKIGEELEQV